MSINVCTTHKGIIGEVQISPSPAVIPSGNNKSTDINIVLASSTQEENQIKVTVTLTDKFGNNIDGIDFNFNQIGRAHV